MNMPRSLASLMRRLEGERGLFSPRLTAVEATADAVALRFADGRDFEFEVEIQRKESAKPYYRAGIALTCAYRPSEARQQCRLAIDKICDAIFTEESEYLPLFGSVPSVEAPTALRSQLDRKALPRLSAALSAMTLDCLTLNGLTDGSAIELRASRNEQQASITLAVRGGQHNPFASGAWIDISVEGTSIDPASHELFAQLIAAVFAHEKEVLDVLVSWGDPTDREGQERSRFAVGRLSTLSLPIAANPNEPLVSGKLAVLYLTSPCFANCIFCGEHTTRNYTYSDVDAVLADIRDNQAEAKKVLIVGYEPLSHPGVPEMVAACRSAGIGDVELMTTGIPLGNATLVDALLGAGLTSVAVPLYSHVAATNDRIMRKSGAFEKTVRGLDAIAGSDCAIHIHSLLLRQNLPDIDPLFDLVTSRWNATFVAAPSRTKNNFEQTSPSYSEISRLVQRAPVLSVPFCIYPRMRHHPDLDMARPLQFSLRDIADCMRGYLIQDLKQMEPCSRCIYQRACLGIIPEQLSLEPALTLVPFTSL